MAGIAAASADAALSLLPRLLITALIFFINVSHAQDVFLTINVKKPLAVTSDKFLSYTLDPTVVLTGNVLTENPERSVNMAKALSPAYVRIGGPRSNSYTFERPHRLQNEEDPVYMITEANWISTHRWAENSGLEILACISPQHSESGGRDSGWDSRNALDLISFSDHMGFNTSWQLGYGLEALPLSFVVGGESLRCTELIECQTRCDIGGADIGRDVTRLRSMLDAFPRYSMSLLTGPDVVTYRTRQQQQYLQDYLNVAGNALSAITWHPDFAGVAMDSDGVSMHHDNLAADRDGLYKVTGRLIAKKPLWLAESKPEKCKNQFLGALVWTRRLGNAARLGVQVLMRQPTDSDLLRPTADYWVSVLHKALVGREVLDAKITTGNRTHVHFYCQCTRPSSKYERGSLTIFGINLTPARVMVNLKGMKIKNVHKYILLPGYDADNRMFSETVMLNNEPLNLVNDNELPPIKPAVSTNSKGVVLKLPSGGIGFWVLPGLKIKACGGQDEDNMDKMLLRKLTKRLGEPESEEDNIHEDEDSEVGNGENMSEERRYLSKTAARNKRRGKYRYSDEDDTGRGYKKIDARMDLERLERLLRRRDSYDGRKLSSRGRPAYHGFEEKTLEKLTSEDNEDIEAETGEEIRAKLEEYKKRLRDYENRNRKIEPRSRGSKIETTEEDTIDSEKVLEAMELISKVENAVRNLDKSVDEARIVGSLNEDEGKEVISDLARPIENISPEDAFLDELLKSEKIKRTSVPTKIEDQLRAIYQMLAEEKERRQRSHAKDKISEDKPDVTDSSQMSEASSSRMRRDIDNNKSIERRSTRRNGPGDIGDNLNKGSDNEFDPKVAGDIGENNFYGFQQLRPREIFSAEDVLFASGNSEEKQERTDYDYMKDDDASNRLDAEMQVAQGMKNIETRNRSDRKNGATIEAGDNRASDVPIEFFEEVAMNVPEVHENLKNYDELGETEAERIERASSDRKISVQSIEFERGNEYSHTINKRTKRSSNDLEEILNHEMITEDDDNLKDCDCRVIRDARTRRKLAELKRDERRSRRRGRRPDRSSFVSRIEERDDRRRERKHEGPPGPKSGDRFNEDYKHTTRSKREADSSNEEKVELVDTESGFIVDDFSDATKDVSRSSSLEDAEGSTVEYSTSTEPETVTNVEEGDQIGGETVDLVLEAASTKFLIDNDNENSGASNLAKRHDNMGSTSLPDFETSIEPEKVTEEGPEVAKSPVIKREDNVDDRELQVTKSPEEMIENFDEEESGITKSPVKRANDVEDKEVEVTKSPGEMVEYFDEEQSERPKSLIKRAEDIEEKEIGVAKPPEKMMKNFDKVQPKKSKSAVKRASRVTKKEPEVKESPLEIMENFDKKKAEIIKSPVIKRADNIVKEQPKVTEPLAESKLIPEFSTLTSQSKSSAMSSEENLEDQLFLGNETNKQNRKGIDRFEKIGETQPPPTQFLDSLESPRTSNAEMETRIIEPRSTVTTAITKDSSTAGAEEVAEVMNEKSQQDKRVKVTNFGTKSLQENPEVSILKTEGENRDDDGEVKVKREKGEIEKTYTTSQSSTTSSDSEELSKRSKSPLDESKLTKRAPSRHKQAAKTVDPAKTRESRMSTRSEALSALRKENDQKKVKKARETMSRRLAAEHTRNVQRRRAEQLEKLRERLRLKRAKLVQDLRDELAEQEGKNNGGEERNLRRREIIDMINNNEEMHDIVDPDKFEYLARNKPVNYEMDDEGRVVKDEVEKYVPKAIDTVRPIHEPRERRVVPRKQTIGATKDPQLIAYGLPEEKLNYEALRRNLEDIDLTDHKIERRNGKSYCTVVESLENPQIYEYPHEAESGEELSIELSETEGHDDVVDNNDMEECRSVDCRRRRMVEDSNEETARRSRNFDESAGSTRNVGSNKFMCLRENSEESASENNDELFKIVKENDHYTALPVESVQFENQEKYHPRTQYVKKSNYEFRQKYNSPKYARLTADKSVRDEKIARKNAESQERSIVQESEETLEEIGSKKMRKKTRASMDDIESWLTQRNDDSTGDKKFAVLDDVDLDEALNKYELLMLIPVNKNQKRSRHKRHVINELSRDREEPASSEIPIEKVLENHEMTINTKDREEIVSVDDNSVADVNTSDVSKLTALRDILNKAEDKTNFISSSKETDEERLKGFASDENIRSVQKFDSNDRTKSLDNDGVPGLLEVAIPRLEATVTNGLGKARQISASFEKFIDGFDDSFNQNQFEIDANSEESKDTDINTNDSPISSDIFGATHTNVKKFFDFLTGIIHIFQIN